MTRHFEPLEARALLSASLAAPAVGFHASPAVSSQQKLNLQKLAKDLNTIESNSDVTPAQIQTLVTDLQAVKAVATKPSKASVQKLVSDARAAAADKQFSPAEKVLLAADVQAVLVSADVPSDLASAVAADVKAIVTASNITSSDVKLIFSDLRTIASTFKAARASR